MSIDNIKSLIPNHAKDIKINIANVLSEEGSQELDQKQIACIALSSAYCCKSKNLIEELENEFQDCLSAEEVETCKSAASIMAMNNVYYRFLHLSSDKEFQNMPAGLRMQIIANPGIDKNLFELCCLAVSAINACGMCIDSHTKQLIEAGVSKQAIQSTVKIASVVNATATAISL